MHSRRSGDQVRQAAWGREQVLRAGEDLSPGIAADQAEAQHPGEGRVREGQDEEVRRDEGGPSSGLLLTKLQLSTQQENDEHVTNNVEYEETYAVEVKRLALYDTGVDKGSPREGLTTPALVLSTRRGLPTTTPATTRSTEWSTPRRCTGSSNTTPRFVEFVNKFDVTRKVSALDLQLTNGLSHQQVNAAHKTHRFNVTSWSSVLSRWTSSSPSTRGPAPRRWTGSRSTIPGHQVHLDEGPRKVLDSPKKSSSAWGVNCTQVPTSTCHNHCTCTYPSHTAPHQVKTIKEYPDKFVVAEMTR